MTITLERRPAHRDEPDEIEYPTSDGKPMAETDIHRDLMFDHIDMLKVRYENDMDVYVSGNNFIYFVEGNPKRCISPDTYVVFGVVKHQRDCYKAWEEGGRLPSIAFEFTSRKTRREDTRIKYPLYEQVLKTQELIRFDPTGDYLKPSLQGSRLVNGRYVPIPMISGRLYSEVLGLELVPEGQNLRLYDPVQKEWLLTTTEIRRRAESDMRARLEAEARFDEQARLAAEQMRLAKEQTQRANEEAQRANEEARARKDSDAEVERLRAELEALRRQIQ